MKTTVKFDNRPQFGRWVAKSIFATLFIMYAEVDMYVWFTSFKPLGTQEIHLNQELFWLRLSKFPGTSVTSPNEIHSQPYSRQIFLLIVHNFPKLLCNLHSARSKSPMRALSFGWHETSFIKINIQ